MTPPGRRGGSSRPLPIALTWFEVATHAIQDPVDAPSRRRRAGRKWASNELREQPSSAQASAIEHVRRSTREWGVDRDGMPPISHGPELPRAGTSRFPRLGGFVSGLCPAVHETAQNEGTRRERPQTPRHRRIPANAGNSPGSGSVRRFPPDRRIRLARAFQDRCANALKRPGRSCRRWVPEDRQDWRAVSHENQSPCPQCAPTRYAARRVSPRKRLNQAEDRKPSNGLEPLTPSLPWKCSTN
jgi:hypothetical protein